MSTTNKEYGSSIACDLGSNVDSLTKIWAHPEGIIAGFKSLPLIDRVNVLGAAARTVGNSVQLVTASVAAISLNHQIEVGRLYLVICKKSLDDLDTYAKSCLEPTLKEIERSGVDSGSTAHLNDDQIRKLAGNLLPMAHSFEGMEKVPPMMKRAVQLICGVRPQTLEALVTLLSRATGFP